MTDTRATNRKAADELFDVRQKIAELRQRESVLRDGFLNGSLPLEGDEHVVVLETKILERVDLALMRQNLEEAVWKPFLLEKSTTYVNLRKREESTHRKGNVAKATASKVAFAK